MRQCVRRRRPSMTVAVGLRRSVGHLSLLLLLEMGNGEEDAKRNSACEEE